ncbi:hypothetical protein [Alloalcanivorax marinus]|uniref:hypothetical protein n=1 Tax=Alloalcanivorax marinus TaxID=1177169 RepID=UPI001958B9C0|nr:hypothetical protein [Alloalcanivorax marinus]MBM7333636.1 hypothetical protein [Alloalcanivorax marinus]
MIYVSLTTTKSRLALCRFAIMSIVNQKTKPDQIILWVSEEPYLSDEGISKTHPPELLLEISKISELVKVKWTRNTGPYRKILPLLNDINDEDIVITADDDIMYGYVWLQELLDHFYNGEQNSVVAARSRKVTRNSLGIDKSYVCWPIIQEEKRIERGFVINCGAGAVFKKSFFRQKDLEDKRFLEVAPTADDLWITKMIVRGEVPLKVAPSALSELVFLLHRKGLVNYNLPIVSGFLTKVYFAFLEKVAGPIGVSVCENDRVYKKLEKIRWLP